MYTAKNFRKSVCIKPDVSKLNDISINKYCNISGLEVRSCNGKKSVK